MTRPFWTSSLLLILCTSAQANIVRPNTFERIELAQEYLPSVQSLPRPTITVTPPPQAELTPGTKILLNGKPCDFKDVPSNATVQRVVLAADGKTIIQVEFATAK
jgi:hypothetical protein